MKLNIGGSKIAHHFLFLENFCFNMIEIIQSIDQALLGNKYQ